MKFTHESLYIVSALLVALILYLPFIGKYFRALNTLNHEIGHVLVTLLSGGKVSSIKIFSDTSGVAEVAHKRWGSRVITAFAGYPFASFIAFVVSYLYVTYDSTIVLLSMMVLASISLLLWMRNLYGVVWAMAFNTISLVVYYNGDQWLSFSYATLITEILLIESFLSALTIFILSVRRKNDAGDATALAQSTKIPTAFWGLVFLLQAGLFSCWGFYFLIGN